MRTLAQAPKTRLTAKRIHYAYNRFNEVYPGCDPTQYIDMSWCFLVCPDKEREALIKLFAFDDFVQGKDPKRLSSRTQEAIRYTRECRNLRPESLMGKIAYQMQEVKRRILDVCCEDLVSFSRQH